MPDALLDQLARVETLHAAWREVAENRGVPGIDRVSVGDFAVDLDANLQRLASELTHRRYRPLAARRVRPPFLAKSDRALVVPTIRDRVVQRAIADLLAPRIEPTLSPVCAAFRRGTSATGAATLVGRWVKEGYPWVMRTDIESFFDTIDRGVLLTKLEAFVDAPSLAFLERILRARVFDHDAVVEPVVGIAQGSPLSPLLANLYLRDLDTELHQRHPRSLRYCDDIITLARDEQEARTALSVVLVQLQPLGLALNEQKTRVLRVEDGFTFLGYRFGPTGRGPAEKAIAALDFRLEALDREPASAVDDIDALYRGWAAYYGEVIDAWDDHPSGILAFLRNASLDAAEIDRLAATRAIEPMPPSPWLGLALAEAWSRVGRSELAWRELEATRRSGRTLDQDTAAWSRALGVSAPQFDVLASDPLPDDANAAAAVLAERAASAGQFEVAERIAAQAANPPPARTKRSPQDAAEPIDPALLFEWFEGRDGAHAVEEIGRGGRRFAPVKRALTIADWSAHLAGERTLAIPLLRSDNTVRLGVFDVDVERVALDRNAGVAEPFLGRALATALRIQAVLGEANSGSLLEFSGHKGYHVWVRFARPLVAHTARRFLHALMAKVKDLPEGIRVEIFPTRDRPALGTLGPLMKLPLGVHGRTGKRCSLLNLDGTTVSDVEVALAGVVAVAPETVERVLAESSWLAPANAVTMPAPPPTTPPEPVTVGAGVRQILDGCKALAHLAAKAPTTSYLNHLERTVLLCSLGHLGDEGRAALHGIIRHTHNYQKSVTDRHVDRLPTHPISCGRIRDLLPEVTAATPCECPRAPRGGGYATPLLFARKPAEIPTFKKKGSPPLVTKSAATVLAQSAQPPTPVTASSAPEATVAKAEEMVARIAELRKQLRGIDAALARVRSDLATLFEAAGVNVIELTQGALHRRRGDDGEWDFTIEI